MYQKGCHLGALGGVLSMCFWGAMFAVKKGSIRPSKKPVLAREREARLLHNSWESMVNPTHWLT